MLGDRDSGKVCSVLLQRSEADIWLVLLKKLCYTMFDLSLTMQSVSVQADQRPPSSSLWGGAQMLMCVMKLTGSFFGGMRRLDYSVPL
jgi:hypothetical protein